VPPEINEKHGLGKSNKSNYFLQLRTYRIISEMFPLEH